MVSLSSLLKSEFLKLIILIFHPKKFHYFMFFGLWLEDLASNSLHNLGCHKKLFPHPIPNQDKLLKHFYGHFHRLALLIYSPLNSATLSCLSEVTLMYYLNIIIFITQSFCIGSVFWNFDSMDENSPVSEGMQTIGISISYHSSNMTGVSKGVRLLSNFY